MGGGGGGVVVGGGWKGVEVVISWGVNRSSDLFLVLPVQCCYCYFFPENLFQERATHTALRQQVSFQLPEVEVESEKE